MTATLSKSRIEDVFEVIHYAAINGHTAPTQQSIAAMLDCSTFTVCTAVKQLQRAQRLEREGNATYWRYHINGSSHKTAWTSSTTKQEGETRRKCMCCGTPFQSQGIHNRICAGCKSANHDDAGYFDTIHTDGLWNGRRMVSV